MISKARFRARWAFGLVPCLSAFGLHVGALDAIEIRGRIKPESGLDMRSIRIDLVEIVSDYHAAWVELSSEPPSRPRVSPSVATTAPDESGRFLLDAAQEGTFAVVVTAAGFLPVRHRLVPLVDTMELEELELTSARRVEVSVLDAAGETVSGAGSY